MNESVSQDRGFASRIGNYAQFLSLCCAVHCLAMPFLIAALPLIGMGFLLNEGVETAVVLSSLALATFSLGVAVRRHRRPLPIVLLAVAACLLIIGRTTGNENIERGFTIAGALILAAAQFVNRRVAGSCSCHCHLSDHTASSAEVA